jgi:hypothetical protein
MSNKMGVATGNKLGKLLKLQRILGEKVNGRLGRTTMVGRQ